MTQEFNSGIPYLRQMQSCRCSPGNANVHSGHIHETALGTSKHPRTANTHGGTRVHRVPLGSRHWGQVPQLCPETRDSPHGSPVTFLTEQNNGGRRAGSEGAWGPGQMPPGRADTQKPHRPQTAAQRRGRAPPPRHRGQPSCPQRGRAQRPVLPHRPLHAAPQGGRNTPQPGPRARPPIGECRKLASNTGRDLEQEGRTRQPGEAGVPAVTQPLTPVRPSATPRAAAHWILSGLPQPHGLQPAELLCPGKSPGKSAAGGCHSLLQGFLPTQGSDPRLLLWQAGSLPPSHRGSLQRSFYKPKNRIIVSSNSPTSDHDIWKRRALKFRKIHAPPRSQQHYLQ